MRWALSIISFDKSVRRSANSFVRIHGDRNIFVYVCLLSALRRDEKQTFFFTFSLSLPLFCFFRFSTFHNFASIRDSNRTSQYMHIHRTYSHNTETHSHSHVHRMLLWIHFSSVSMPNWMGNYARQRLLKLNDVLLFFFSSSLIHFSLYNYQCRGRNG